MPHFTVLLLFFVGQSGVWKERKCMAYQFLSPQVRKTRPSLLHLVHQNVCTGDFGQVAVNFCIVRLKGARFSELFPSFHPLLLFFSLPSHLQQLYTLNLSKVRLTILPLLVSCLKVSVTFCILLHFSCIYHYQMFCNTYLDIHSFWFINIISWSLCVAISN